MKFYEYLDNYKYEDIDIYFDMDGVFAEYDIGNFDYETIRPINTVIEIMKKLNGKGINIKVLSICKNDKVVDEKIVWLNKYLPFLEKSNINLISKEEFSLESNELKSIFLKDKSNKEHIIVLVDDDSQIIKKVVKENEDVKVFHVSSIIY